MKKNFIVIISIFLLQSAVAQPFNVDSLKRKIEQSAEDTSRVRMLGLLSTYYNHNHLDSGFYFSQQMIALSQKLKYPYGEAWGLSILATSADRTGDLTKSLEIALSCLHLAETLTYGKDEMMTRAYTQIGVVNLITGHEAQARSALYEALLYAKNYYPDETYYYQIYAHIGHAFRREALADTNVNSRKELLDSSLFYIQKAYALSLHSDNVFFFPYVRNCEGDINIALGKTELAKQFYRDAIIQGTKVNHFFQLSNSYTQISLIFNGEGMPDSAIYYAKKSMDLSRKFYYGGDFITEASNQLSKAFEKLHQPDSALKYLKLSIEIKERVMNQTKIQQLQLLDFEEQQRQEKANIVHEQYISKIRTTILISGLIVLVMLLGLLYRNNRVKQKSNIQLLNKTKELQKTMQNLREAQSQLVQSEKMASLGELTAGIAHEIQNPLNFVNNFSDINKDLLFEMNEEIKKGNFDEAKEIAKNVTENEEKISHHGKRADAIVKGMLQHSRSSTGAKELTDINKLADEYLRLAYHGFRAKEKDFNVKMETDFDNTIGQINIIPQDIGRVLLNLYNNAFYAVAEKQKQLAKEMTAFEKLSSLWQPVVIVSTKKSGNQISITVSDNGNGIPASIKEKIFQPFFTTKPTGQGTGLGLSLSYDIVKAHGGEIKVEPVEREGTTFKIMFPV